jgi:hypothetical protein
MQKKTINEIVPISQAIQINDFNTSDSNYKLTAFEYILLQTFLDKHNLAIGKEEQMQAEDNNVLLPVATVDAIKKALHYLS